MVARVICIGNSGLCCLIFQDEYKVDSSFSQNGCVYYSEPEKRVDFICIFHQQ